MASQGQLVLWILIAGVLALAGSAKKCDNVLKVTKRRLLTNGAVRIHKATLLYSCKDGYKLLGNAKRSCKRGKIVGKLPKCVRNISCGTPFLTGGNFSGMAFTVGARITYKCNRGFKMIGGAKLSKCKRDGKWSNVKPTCQRIQCSAHKLMNGNVTSSDPNYYHGAKLYFTCDDNYELRGPDTLTCTEASTWDRRRPYCKAIKCPDPGLVPNGLLHGRNFMIGQKVTFSCYAGYTLLGSRERTCLKSRRWDGSLAVCDDGNSYCPILGTPIKGDKDGSQYDQGDTVKFSCEDGYVLRGSSVRMCMQDRQWNGTEAFCIDEHEASFMNENETAMLLRSNLLDTVMEYTCTDDNSTCNQTTPTEFDSRARAFDVNYKGGLDVVFVIDGSSSIRREEFELALNFSKALVELIGANRRKGLPVAHFAAVTYGSIAQLEFNLGDMDSTEKIIERIGKITRVMGGTATASALEMVHKVVAPMARRDKRILIFLTDGKSNIGGSPVREAKKLKDEQDFEIYVIGVGRQVNRGELMDIASDYPTLKEHIITVRSYKTLKDSIDKAVKITTDYSPCGQSRFNPRARMVNGLKSERGMWPWMVRIFKKNFDDGKEKLVCGGSLIRRDWILTAAHCFKDKAYNPGIFNLAIGDHKVDKEEHSELKIVAEKIFVHQQYKPAISENDIALIRLEKNVTLTKFVRTLCLSEKDLATPGKYGYAAGWGVTTVMAVGEKGARTSNVLRHAAFIIQEDSVCSNKTKDLNTNVTFCAGDGKGGNDTCKGDSGGPFMRQDAAQWTAAGIVSWGEGCGLKDKYGYYTRVAPFVDWIEKTIKDNTVLGDDD